MGFMHKPIEHGLIFSDEAGFYPSSLWGHREGKSYFESPTDHTFGLVMSGQPELESPDRGRFSLPSGMYFSVPGKFSLSGTADVALFRRSGYRGLFLIGGPVESRGRLCYINDASTTLICPPPRNGDPCLNLLTFPPNILQSAHIHPTVRLGAVIGGSGECVLGKDERIKLRPGLVFQIEAGLVHSFSSGEHGLSVVAYHPDSEGGPTDSNHPMLVRTYLK
jgi:hypothetical protein